MLVLQPQVCGEQSLFGWAYIEDTAECDGTLEHMCTVGEWPQGWEWAACCSPDPAKGCSYAAGACPLGLSPTCGFIPVQDPEPWVCSPLGTLDAYVSETAACEVGELRVCTYGETPADPLALACCTAADSCRLVPSNEACAVDEWIACGHNG